MRTMTDLKQMQSLPLEAKVAMSRVRIKGWINEFGEDGVYMSFSGGKDSTVLLDLIRNQCGYRDIPAVFVDVPTQYPELKQFATSFDDVEVLKPKISFMEVCERYGFPLISKEVSSVVFGARQYLRKLESLDDGESADNIPYHDWYNRLTGQGNYAKQDLNKLAEHLSTNMGNGGSNYRTALLLGLISKDGQIKIPENSNDRSNFSQEKYKFFLEAPFEISDRCCNVMKKKPVHDYSKKTGRMPMTAQMAEESALRQQAWLKNGCNGFNMKAPISNPMSFWTEQDVLQYIKDNNLPICSVYGDVVEDDNRLFLPTPTDKPHLKTTGCKRTGCMLCGFGCHLEKSPNRFEMLKETHPKMYGLLDVVTNNGVTFREAIEWTNEHGNLNIRL